MCRWTIVILFAGLVFSPLFGQNTWQQKDSINGPGKSVVASFVLGGHGFVVAGLGDFSFKRKVYSYNPNQNDWDDEVSLGGENGDGLERGSATGFSIGDKGYVCLGQGETNPFFNDLWEYDDNTKIWSQKADFIGSARSQAVGFVVDNYAYVGTGQDANGLTNDFYKYDQQLNTWTAISSFPGTARRQAVGFAMGAQGYVGTGDDGILKKDFWQYQPVTDTWVQKMDFPGTARAGATGWGIFPTAFIATGEDLNFELKKDVWEYNYFANAWVQRIDFSGSPRKNAFSFEIDGIGYLGAGYDGTFQDDFYAYSPMLILEEKTNKISSNIYPNPIENFAKINTTYCKEEMAISFYDVAGKNVGSQVGIVRTQEGYAIDVTLLPAGNYLYSLKSEAGSAVFSKFIRL
jgi:N-acetylneuraminic acid mutarotase